MLAPVASLDRNQLAIVEADREDVTFERREIEKVAIGSPVERSFEGRCHSGQPGVTATVTHATSEA
jgi:hypothetical protein